MRGGLALWIGLWASTSAGASLEERQAQLGERLAAERAALESLQEAKGAGLALLDGMEKLSRDSTAQVEAMRARLAVYSAQLAVATRLEELSAQALRDQLLRLSPRLKAMYRGTRQDRLGLLLSAADFATLLRRSRGIRELLRQDMLLLESARSTARYQKDAAARLGRLQAISRKGVAAFEQEAAAAELRRQAFLKVLEKVKAGAEHSAGLISELEEAEARLSEMIDNLASADDGDFRARKGHLPFPTRGFIEVGFGKVINPKFNTVTVQKGVDIRVREGTPVLAVAAGTVAFAGWLKGYGNLVILDHGSGYHTLSAHLASMEVEAGNQLQAGEQVGTVGDTGSLKGPYLYFEIRQKGQAVDPARWLDEEASFE